MKIRRGGGSLRGHDVTNNAIHMTSTAVMCEGKMREGHRGHGQATRCHTACISLAGRQRQRASVGQRIVKFVLE